MAAADRFTGGTHGAPLLTTSLVTGVRCFDAARGLVVTARPAHGPSLGRLGIRPAPAVVARLLARRLLAAPAAIVVRLRTQLSIASAATAGLPLPLLVARLRRLAFRGRFHWLGFVPPGSQATLLRLLAPQFVVLAGRTMRLTAALVARLSSLPSLAALARLPLVRALLALPTLAGPLVGPLPGLAVGVVTRLLRPFGAGFTALGLVSGGLLGWLPGTWPAAAATTLAGSLR